MDVTLRGNSPVTLVAGILLLSRARSFGVPAPRVAVVGDAESITPVLGPAALHSTVLASCGVGRDLGEGALVVVRGAPDEPLLLSLAREGLGSWFAVDNAGEGLHPGTRAFMRLSRDRRAEARQLGRALRAALRRLGLPAEPALLDLLFGAPAPPLVRISLALRAGRSITGEQGQAITSFLTPGFEELPDPLPPGLTGEEVLQSHGQGRLEPILSRLRLDHRDAVESWVAEARALAAEDGGRDLDLIAAFAELVSHVAVLPGHCMLPPPDAAADSVAMGLGRALGAVGVAEDANRSLVEIFRFLGGRFVDEARHAIQLPSQPPPEDRAGRWRWFVEGANEAAHRADELWRHVVDMPS